jgi:hypothetical protein
MDDDNAVEHIETAAKTVPVSDWSDADLAAMMKRSARNVSVFGAAVAAVAWAMKGWQTAALFAVGGAMSVLSIYEWGRLMRVLTVQMDAQTAANASSGSNSGLGTGRVVVFFMLRMVLFAGGIYGSLKCLHGSPIALICGLGLGVAGLAWEAVRTLRR